MRALTIRQPWASAIIFGGKDVENRSRPTRIRERIAIHAGAHKISDAVWNEAATRHPALHALTYPFGQIIGTVEIVDCVHANDWDFREKSKWADPDCWHWILARPKAFAIPAPVKGSLSFWRWECCAEFSTGSGMHAEECALDL